MDWLSWFGVNSLRLSDLYMCQETNHHWFRQWLVAWSAPSHYLNQCWNIVNWTLRNTNFSEILIAIHMFSFKKLHLKMSSGKWRPFCLSLNVSTYINSWKFSGVYSALWSLMPWCWIARPSVTTVLTNYSFYLTSFIQQYYIYNEHH